MTNTPYGKSDGLARLVLGLAVVLSGLSAGFFASYQYSVTRALLDVTDAVYVSTFQAINASIRSPEFGLIFFGALPALVLAAWCYRQTSHVRTLLVLAIAGYIATLAITFSVHIPLNNALALVGANDSASAARATFEMPWNTMHLVRTLTALAAFVLATAAAMIPTAINRRRTNTD